MNKVVWILGAGVLVYLLTRKTLAKNIKVIFRGLSFSGGLKKPSFLLRFAIQNPTASSATVQSLTGQVEMNGRTIADVSSFQSFSIDPNSEKVYTVTATPSGGGLVSTLVNYFRSKERQAVQVKFIGTANVDGLNIPLSNNITL